MTDYWRCSEEAINLVLIMKPLNQRVGSHQYWSMASWINHKHQKPWSWEVKLLSSSWAVWAHIKSSPKSEAEVPAQLAVPGRCIIPFLDQTLSPCCCRSSSLGAAFPRLGASSFDFHICFAQSRALFAESQGKTSVLLMSQILWFQAKTGFKKGSFPAACERREVASLYLFVNLYREFSWFLTACESMAFVPNHLGDLCAPSPVPFQISAWIKPAVLPQAVRVGNASLQLISSTIPSSSERAQSSFNKK